MSRGDRTRERLLDVAEQLFAAETLGRVSMRQIRIAAGQRNEGVVQYYFGDINGVIKALSDRHSPRVQVIQDRIVAEAGPNPSMRAQVESITRPLVEYATHGTSARAWVRILADLMTDPALGFDAIQEGSPRRAAEIGYAVFERLALEVPRAIAADRVWAVSQFVIQMTADRARLQELAEPTRYLLPDDVFIDNVIAMAYGALMAPAPRHEVTPVEEPSQAT